MEKYELVDIKGNKTGKILSIYTNEKAYFTVYYVRKNVNIAECKLQTDELEEIKFFKIEELQYLDNEGLEWLEDLKKL